MIPKVIYTNFCTRGSLLRNSKAMPKQVKNILFFLNYLSFKKSFFSRYDYITVKLFPIFLHINPQTHTS